MTCQPEIHLSVLARAREDLGVLTAQTLSP